MIDALLSPFAPHLCCGCGTIGRLLCDNCKYNITSEVYSGCVGCGRLAGSKNVCNACRVSYPVGWCVGERSGVLQRLIGDFKFQRMYAAYRPLADLLLQTVGQLPEGTVVVPIPTVASHIRQRGYDHTAVIAKRFALRRKLRMMPYLQRRTNTKQRDANFQTRQRQAKEAFMVRGTLDPSVPYLIIDDVVTTGATIRYAAAALRQAGAQTIFVAVIARQPLD